MDPSLYPEPEKYKGFRFHDLHEEAQKKREEEAKNVSDEKRSSPSVAYAASHPASMAFGYGRHACPGRFFASAEIKAIMVYLLMNYDFKFPKGKPERPQSLQVETQNLPNHEATLMFKRRN